jgi:hypothetical protein
MPVRTNRAILEEGLFGPNHEPTYRSIRPRQPQPQHLPQQHPQAQYMVNLRPIPQPPRPRTAPGSDNPPPPPPRRPQHWGGQPAPPRHPSDVLHDPDNYHPDPDVPYVVQRHNIADVDTSIEIQAIKTQLNMVKCTLDRAQIVLQMVTDTLDKFDLHLA